MNDDAPSNVEAASGTPLQFPTNHSHHILVVDEDSDLRLLYADALERPDCRVDAAEDGAAAWRALNVKNYDLLITDNNMPKLSGVELLKKVHAARMALPVIMATGTLPTEEFTRYPWLQPDATLLKPYTLSDLMATVNKVLRAADGARERIAPSPCWQSQPSTVGLRV